MDNRLKETLIFSGIATAAIMILGGVASYTIGQAMAPEEAQLAPKQLEDDSEAYQVARGGNVGIVQMWLFIGLGISIAAVWIVSFVIYALGKPDEEDTTEEV